MRNGAAMGLQPRESLDLSGIVSPYVWYRLQAAGNQVDAGGAGPTLIETNTAAALGALALDFDTDTRYNHSGDNTHLHRICAFDRWTDGAGLIVCFTAVIPTTPSAALFAVLYGIDNTNGGWNVAISTSRELQLKWELEGASSAITQTNFLTPTPAADVRQSFAIDMYLSDATTAQVVVYQNGDQVGSLTDVDLSVNGGVPTINTRELTIGARRTAASSYSAYYGATANSELSNVFLTRLATRDTTLAQDLSAWWADNPGDPPEPMIGK